MLNVCFGDSEAGMLKCALRGETVTYSHRLLDLGGIDAQHFAEGRRKWIDNFFSMCSKRTRSKIWKEDCKRFDQIIEAATREKELRIWFASSPHSRCGLYCLVYSLQHIDCQIYVVEMPTNIGYREEWCDKSWGEATPEEARNCLKLERLLSIEERNDISRKWAKLAEENAELRLNVNGEVTSLPIDYLDEEIMSYAPKDKEFKLGNLVGTTLGKCVHAVSDAFIADRIEAMIDGGLFVVVGDRPKKAREYYSKTFIRVATDEDIAERRERAQYVTDTLTKLGVDEVGIIVAVADGKLEKSYTVLKKSPRITKKRVIKKMGLEEYERNPLPPIERTYTDADFKKK